jgi:transposase-like protein
MMPSNAPTARTCRQYDPTFQLEAIRSWLGGGKSVEVVAQELGLSPGVHDHCLRAAPRGRTFCREAAGVGR